MNDFSKYLQSFFMKYLIGECGVSRHTIRAYRDAFTLFLTFMKSKKLKKADVLRLADMDRNTISDFLEWLEFERNNSTSTRNQRFAAIRSFCNYLTYEDPIRIAQWQSIRSIPVKGKIEKTISYLTVDGVKLIFAQIPKDTKNSRRNLALLALLYYTGARAQELADLKPSCLRLEKPYTVKLFGKGQKERIIPLQEEQIESLKEYIKDFKLDRIEKQSESLFFNRSGGKLTTAGITYILKKYAQKARLISTELIPLVISPHIFRHSKAMHLLQAGINLIYIRDLLGHSSIQTTEKYIRLDSKQKREALESAFINILPKNNNEPSWHNNSQLKDFLKSLG